MFANIGFKDKKELPIAYYRFQTHSKKSMKNRGGGYSINNDEINKCNNTILCADPVNLAVGLNDITLTQQIVDLTKDEAKQCIEALNQHFEQDGLEFIYGSNFQWYLLLNSKAEIKTVPLSDVLRRNIAHHLPDSSNVNWKTILNETQMILHSLPLNQEREQVGLPLLNSLWFYGGGNPEVSTHDIDAISSSSNDVGKMLSRAADCTYYPLSKDHCSNTLKSRIGKYLIIFDQLLLPAIYDDIEEYQRQLNLLEGFLEPLIEAWQSGELDLIIDSCDGKSIKPIKNPKWQFWTKNSLPLSNIAQSVAQQ